jgi:hypothetical protein
MTTEEGVAMIVPPVKCMISHAQIVGRKLKFRSSLMAPDRYIAGTAIKNIDQKDFKFEMDNISDLKFF